jgi:serine/threonine protein kinase
MPLAPGSNIGPYQILSPIGAGGMGQVWRARDTKLDREVAIKLLPAEFARDPERLARFTREAKVLAALNHPNIAQIYGLEESAEGPALVMELIQGETIRGPLPELQALEYARQIAAALEAAHEKAIVHRDLKPANIMCTADGVIKVLDFGIASVAQPPHHDPNNSPTLTLASASAGLILGTAGYMSPEQASGKPVDKRSDIFSFGVVLYELLTGKRLFAGETVSHTLAAVLTLNPDLTVLPPATRTLVKRCLEKDPKRRLRDIGDAFLSEEPPAVPTTTHSSKWLIPGLAAAVLAAGAIGWSLRPVPKPPELPPRVFTVPTPGTDTVNSVNIVESNSTISPNGRYIAFVKDSSLWIRDLAIEQPRIVDGVSRPYALFWSPDSKHIGFMQELDIKTAPVDAGPPRRVATLDGRPRAAAWSLDGTTILICSGTGKRLLQVSASGGPGTPLQAWTPPADKYLTSISFVPSAKGERILVGGLGNSAAQDIIIVNLESGKERNLGSGHYPVYAGNNSILYQTENDLSALRMLRFHPDTWEQIGDSTAVLASAWRPAVSAEETLVWMDPPFDISQKRQLAWRDRTGRRLVSVGGPEQRLQSLELSPDGLRAAFSATDGTNRDVFIFDLARSVRTRLTNDPEFDGAPVWSPDGKEIAFRSSRTGLGDVYIQAADGSTPPTVAVAGPQADFPRAWSPDGKTILFVRQTGDSGFDLWATERRPDGSFGPPTPFLQSNSDQNQPAFSPDGRYVVYASYESGRSEIYVRAFPSGAERIQVSTDGGAFPRWSANGKEIFFLKDDTMISVPVSLQPVFQARPQVELFRLRGLAGVYAPFDVTADGQRFLISEPSDSTDPKPTSLHIIQNWRGLLKQ